MTASARSSSSTCSSSDSGILRPPAAKSLTPLSPYGLWLAEITARGRAALTGDVGDAGRGEHPDEHDVGTLGAEPGHERGLEHRTRAPGVTPDDEGLVATEHAHRGAAERGDELGGELPVGNPAHPVGAEAQRHDVGTATRLSASSTAEPYGPS